jgi:hypothetical protein
MSYHLTGTVTLTNTKEYPFNNSTQTVALDKSLPNQDYAVLTEIVGADGDAGDIVVSGKAVNGFKIAYMGSAKEAVVRYHVIGGAAL